MSLTPNYTCEICWCVVLVAYARQHNEWHENQGGYSK